MKRTVYFVRAWKANGAAHVMNCAGAEPREAFDQLLQDHPGAVVETITPLFDFEDEEPKAVLN